MAEARARRAARQCWLAIMAKPPRLGTVKSRLAREAGPVEALRFYRATAGHVVRRLASDPRWRTVLALASDAACRGGPWPGHVPRIGQGRGDLGARMQRLFDSLPPGPVVVVGSDIPRLAPAHVARAFRLLGDRDAVLGPAEDGGYWLVGLRRCPKVLAPFRNVRWGTCHALADTRANLACRRVALADVLADVDDAAGYRRLKGAGARLVIPPG